MAPDRLLEIAHSPWTKLGKVIGQEDLPQHFAQVLLLFAIQSTEELRCSLFLFPAGMTGTYLQITAGAQPSQQSAN